MYDLNIVIVNWKAKEEIDVCLNSLFGDIRDTGLNVIVHIVDNSGNVDGIRELIEEKYQEYPNVVYLDPEGNIGFGKAQNWGLRQQEARFYLPLNPDIEFLPGESTLKRLIDLMNSDQKVGLAAPKLLNSDGSLQYSCCRFPAFWDQLARRLGLDKRMRFFRKRVDDYLMKDFDHKQTVPVDWVMGSFMLIKKEATEKVGLFDERFFMYFEDCDLCRRIWEKGWRVYYVHDTQVKHTHHRDSDDISPWRAVFKNPVTRIHLKSWMKYFWKWGMRRKRYGY